MKDGSATDVIYKRILVPTDGSEYSFTAGRHAVYLASNLGAELIILNVIDVDMAFHAGIHYAESVKALEQAGQEAISRIEALARERGVTTRSLLVRGDPKDAILKLACEEKADCIVMGSIGMSAIERVLVGSVSESVSRHAGCPVLLVRS